MKTEKVIFLSCLLFIFYHTFSSRKSSVFLLIIEQRTNLKSWFQAKNLFLKGIENEQTGKLYEAIQFYKRAVQLVPDIEFRLYESTKVKPQRYDPDGRIDQINSDSHAVNKEEYEETEDEDGDSDLFSRLSRIVSRNQCVCFPSFEQSVSTS